MANLVNPTLNNPDHTPDLSATVKLDTVYDPLVATEKKMQTL